MEKLSKINENSTGLFLSDAQHKRFVQITPLDDKEIDKSIDLKLHYDYYVNCVNEKFKHGIKLLQHSITKITKKRVISEIETTESDLKENDTFFPKWFMTPSQAYKLLRPEYETYVHSKHYDIKEILTRNNFHNFISKDNFCALDSYYEKPILNYWPIGVVNFRFTKHASFNLEYIGDYRFKGAILMMYDIAKDEVLYYPIMQFADNKLEHKNILIKAHLKKMENKFSTTHQSLISSDIEKLYCDILTGGILTTLSENPQLLKSIDQLENVMDELFIDLTNFVTNELK
jgi:hypothetical protein